MDDPILTKIVKIGKYFLFWLFSLFLLFLVEGNILLLQIFLVDGGPIWALSNL